eukprot:8626035-Prorocentrum_lima.AAC.1
MRSGWGHDMWSLLHDFSHHMVPVMHLVHLLSQLEKLWPRPDICLVWNAIHIKAPTMELRFPCRSCAS